MKKSHLLKVKKSKIAGKGVFAASDIEQGKTICFFQGEEINLDEMIRRVDEGLENGSDPLGIGEELYLDLDELSRTFNHSCNPNAFIKGKNELIAIREIKSGEEINYDYSTTMNDNKEKIEKSGGALWTCKCKCGADNCRKVIDQFIKLPISFQEIYLKNKFAPDFILEKFATEIL